MAFLWTNSCPGPWNIGRVHKTLVSNMIIADFSVEARWLSHGLPRWDVKFHTTERNGSEGYHDGIAIMIRLSVVARRSAVWLVQGLLNAGGACTATEGTHKGCPYGCFRSLDGRRRPHRPAGERVDPDRRFLDSSLETAPPRVVEASVVVAAAQAPGGELAVGEAENIGEEVHPLG